MIFSYSIVESFSNSNGIQNIVSENHYKLRTRNENGQSWSCVIEVHVRTP